MVNNYIPIKRLISTKIEKEHQRLAYLKREDGLDGSTYNWMPDKKGT